MARPVGQSEVDIQGDPRSARALSGGIGRRRTVAVAAWAGWRDGELGRPADTMPFGSRPARSSCRGPPPPRAKKTSLLVHALLIWLICCDWRGTGA